jgi:homoaconitase/3-isopropylmalate dehydratase large subunit
MKEFGGVTGIFVPDMVTQEYIDTRKVSHNRKGDNYFYPDADAEYEFTYVIDLAKVQPFVALYPSPDNVVPVSDVISRDLDGCFIGACTTTEEDLVLAALVLKAGLERGLKPIVNGKRKLVPGSLPILRRLREQGLLDVYKEAGFEIGVPGCSYCVGMSADKAEEGEVWLSSQNRNFQNRMGKGM